MKIDLALLRTEIGKYVDWPDLVNRWQVLVRNLKNLEDGIGNPLTVFDAIKRALTSLEEIVTTLIMVVEKISGDIPDLKGEKRDAVVKLLDDVIQLPGILELFDGKIIGIIVDQVVGQFNKVFGHDWSDPIARLPGMNTE